MTRFVVGLFCALVAQAGQAAVPTVISELNQPLLFAYGTWQNRATIQGGKALLSGPGLTPRGGAGCNQTVDLHEATDRCPALQLKVGPANTMGSLRLLLRDTGQGEGTWVFALPRPSDEWVTLTPNDGAPLKQPNEVGKSGGPDLAKIMQWQLTGDWRDDKPVDVTVEAILVVEPSPAALQARVAREQREAAAREQQKREQQALRERYGKRNPNSPVVERVSLVAPDVVAVTVHSGKITPGRLAPYQPQAGDTRRVVKGDDGQPKQVFLVRGGQDVGWLIGPQRDQLVSFEQFTGDPLLADLAADPATYALSSADDPTFAQPAQPASVARKSTPTDWCQHGNQFEMRHEIYLRMPRALVPGKTYTLRLGDLNTQPAEMTWKHDPAAVRSEAVHINQVGFRPDDPAKRAFLSLWQGTGGALAYPTPLRFRLVDDRSGQPVYTGEVTLACAADQPEKMWRTEAFNKTNVYRLDFAAFNRPGRYRVSVDGVGCSYPFEIGRDVWTKAFALQLRGLYHQRSGMALGPPYTNYLRPRDFFPADGTRVFQSTHSVLDDGNEWEVAKHSTAQAVPEAWGGYHDAGDWNPRRVTHLRVTMAQLEVLQLYPTVLGPLEWNIPRTIHGPAVLDEALYELDCFRRLQLPSGAVRYGIETASDPIEGEVSWLQSQPAYVYAADVSSTYYYAGVAARAAKLLAASDPALAATYRASALSAMAWAEGEWARHRGAKPYRDEWHITDYRNLAAVVLLDLTGDRHWHEVFLQNTCLTDPAAKLFVWGHHTQSDAAFAYCLLPPELADPALRAKAVRGIEQLARQALDYAANNAFNLTTPDQGKPMFLGFYSTPDAVDVVRAHYLTHKPEYLAGAVQACQFQTGCNPNNLTYTTGLGSNPIRHPLKLDARLTGQPAPEGITVYGNVDFVAWNQDWITWPLTWFLGKECIPSAWNWPIPEAWWDIYRDPSRTEFTVDMWAPNVYVWGYLAARP